MDLSKFEKLTLPWVACHDDDDDGDDDDDDEKQDFLEIGSIDKNAFDEFTNLTCLHLKLTQPKLQPHTYDKLDFKHLINLKDLCFESKGQHRISRSLCLTLEQKLKVKN